MGGLGSRRRAGAIALLSAALLAAGGLLPASGAASRAKRKVCVQQFSLATECKVEPRRLGIGAKGAMKRIHWRRWGGRKAVGFGSLTVAGFPSEPGDGIGPTRAKVKLKHRVRCKGSRWYSRITITYGPDLERTYVRNAAALAC